MFWILSVLLLSPLFLNISMASEAAAIHIIIEALLTKTMSRIFEILLPVLLR